ncbi:MAG: metallophosphoesterase [Actinomycetota bacterium]
MSADREPNRRRARVTARARSAWPLIVVMTASILGIVLWPYFTSNPNLGVQAKPRVRQLIYPTFGNPAIVESGSPLVIEFDPRDRRFDTPFLAVENCEVTARTSIDPVPVEMALPVRSVKPGTSTRWPEYAAVPETDRTICLVTVEVPAALPEDLYDLTVRARVVGGEETEDFQPHALQAVERYKDRFSFCQLTDIHVYGPECDYPSAHYHERSRRPNGINPTRDGAVYYQKTIDQVNVMKPDFCVFTGDYMFGQSYLLQDQGFPWKVTTEYEYEMLWFYEETLKLDVPVFLVMGNHEFFAEGDNAAREDWFENWRRLFGPVYHSFDYGSAHFLAVNSQDWPLSQRVLTDYGVSIQSDKYKGQFMGNGDPWQPGVSPERVAAIDTTALAGQLAWMRDDLAAHQSSSIRVVATHQDPWRKAGEGRMWASQGSDDLGFLGAIKTMIGFAGKYGNGYGRLAAVRLMAEYRVALEVSGHFHSDSVESFPWLGGGGQVLCVNTTCAQFNVDGLSRSYPGYRRIWIAGGTVESYNYKDPRWSYPSYAGVNVGGVTNLGRLTKPAFASVVEPDSGRAEKVAWVVGNTLEKPLPAAFAKLPVPYLDDGYYYVARNGRLVQAHDDRERSPRRRVLIVRTDVPPRRTHMVEVEPSARPDERAPEGTVTIQGGAAYTTSLSAVLDLRATDPGGSGLKDVMISNSPDFEDAAWQPCVASVPWTLADGPAGEREVYVRFRDWAMPPNISDLAEVSIVYAPQ